MDMNGLDLSWLGASSQPAHVQPPMDVLGDAGLQFHQEPDQQNLLHEYQNVTPPGDLWNQQPPAMAQSQISQLPETSLNFQPINGTFPSAPPPTLDVNLNFQPLRSLNQPLSGTLPSAPPPAVNMKLDFQPLRNLNFQPLNGTLPSAPPPAVNINQGALVTLPPCPGTKIVSNSIWYGHPKLPTCPVCWVTFAHPMLADVVGERSVLAPEPLLCAFGSSPLRRNRLLIASKISCREDIELFLTAESALLNGELYIRSNDRTIKQLMRLALQLGSPLGSAVTFPAVPNSAYPGVNPMQNTRGLPNGYMPGHGSSGWSKSGPDIGSLGSAPMGGLGGCLLGAGPGCNHMGCNMNFAV